MVSVTQEQHLGVSAPACALSDKRAFRQTPVLKAPRLQRSVRSHRLNPSTASCLVSDYNEKLSGRDEFVWECERGRDEGEGSASCQCQSQIVSC